MELAPSDMPAKATDDWTGALDGLRNPPHLLCPSGSYFDVSSQAAVEGSCSAVHCRLLPRFSE
eukprot:1528185-Amphidinium_carterae.1